METPQNNRSALVELIAPDLSRMIADRHFDQVRAVLAQADLHDPEVAEIVGALEPQERVVLFRLLPHDRAADVFSYLPDSQQRQLLDELGSEQLAAIFNEMEPDDRTQLLGEMPEQQVARLMALLRPDEREQAQSLLEYPPESVGRLATPDYLTARLDWTARQVLDHIRVNGEKAETLQTLYVVDERGRLVDDLPLRTVLLSDPSRKVESLVDGQVLELQATADREEAVRMLEKYDVPVLPVVDENRRLMGIVTFDDVADVAEEEATEDIQKAAAIAPLPMEYTQTGVWTLVRRRIGWLVVLVFVSLLSSGVIAAHEQTLHQVIALAFFLPLLAASGGNTGAQSATLLIRALSVGDVKLSQWAYTLAKEMLVGLTLGLIMGGASAVLGFFRGDMDVALIVGLSMLCIVLSTNLIGAILPFLLTRLRIDPAVASSPLITTLADATGLLIYFTIARWVLSHHFT